MSAGASISEPPPRSGHFSAPIEGHLCVSGGRTKGSTKEKGELVHTFNQLSESWSSKQCQGPSPPDGLYYGASAYAGHHLYLYGGHDGSHNIFRTPSTSWTQGPGLGVICLVLVPCARLGVGWLPMMRHCCVLEGVAFPPALPSQGLSSPRAASTLMVEEGRMSFMHMTLKKVSHMWYVTRSYTYCVSGLLLAIKVSCRPPSL